MNADKKSLGQFFTRGNPFRFAPFRAWARAAGLPGARLLEPFAGANHIVSTLRAGGLCGAVDSFDLEPAHADVARRDCIADFPRGYRVTVTNPPWLARNSATRSGISFPGDGADAGDQHDDLYKYCLEACLAHCDYAALLMPASYLQTNLRFDRLHTYILLHEMHFNDTENPTCLALFTPHGARNINLYHDNTRIGDLAALAKHLPVAKTDRRARFNDPDGALGFVSFDNTRAPSIHFCRAGELSDYTVKHSSRFITRISGKFGNAREVDRLIARLNHAICDFRANTRDAFLTPFKGIRRDGAYRRRMKFKMARNFINAAVEPVNG